MMPRKSTSASRSAMRAAVLAVLVLGGTQAVASAQTPQRVVPAVAEMSEGTTSGVIPASCTSCGSLPGGPGYGPGVHGWGHKHGPLGYCDIGCGDEGCGEAGCVAGRGDCETCEGQHRLTRMFCAFHNALCCPDPCYEPRWMDGANASLFVPTARPATYTRFRWDYGNDLRQPDRAEYFWAATGLKGPPNPETRVNYHELSIYAEMGGDRFAFFIDTAYRNVRPDMNAGAGQFGDLILGTKTLLLDSELLQTTFQFRTFIPTGSAGKGIGTGHVSLEPSMLWAIKLYPETYWQGQVGYWIPIGGTPNPNGGSFAGGVFIFNNSLNHLICRPLRDTALYGTIESTGYNFTSGAYTDPNGEVRRGNNSTYFNIGPGFRFAVCDKIDFGFGMQFAVTSDHFAQQLYRTEFRWRF
jgi:hypothetical protein